MDWYQLITKTDKLEQGDFIYDCPIVIPPVIEDMQEIPEMEVGVMDTIILSQSCDLENGNIEIVQVCPFYNLETYLKNLPSTRNSSRKLKEKEIKNLQQGIAIGYHLLDLKEDFGITDYLVVDFRNVYGVHIDTLKGLTLGQENRVRLNSPYKEHLSQAYARFLMRVGLPQNISVTKTYH